MELKAYASEEKKETKNVTLMRCYFSIRFSPKQFNL